MPGRHSILKVTFHLIRDIFRLSDWKANFGGVITMKGRCFCGSVEYELTSPIQDSYYCHCRDCQYMSGSSFRVLGIVGSDSLDFKSGELSEFEHKTQDGSVMKRYFCPRCGTPLYNTSTRFRDIQMLCVNTLDEPEAVKPSMEIWTTSKVTWAHIDPDIMSHPYGALDGSEAPKEKGGD